MFFMVQIRRQHERPAQTHRRRETGDEAQERVHFVNNFLEGWTAFVQSQGGDSRHEKAPCHP